MLKNKKIVAATYEVAGFTGSFETMEMVLKKVLAGDPVNHPGAPQDLKLPVGWDKLLADDGSAPEFGDTVVVEFANDIDWSVRRVFLFKAKEL